MTFSKSRVHAVLYKILDIKFKNSLVSRTDKNIKHNASNHNLTVNKLFKMSKTFSKNLNERIKTFRLSKIAKLSEIGS